MPTTSGSGFSLNRSFSRRRHPGLKTPFLLAIVAIALGDRVGLFRTATLLVPARSFPKRRTGDARRTNHRRRVEPRELSFGNKSPSDKMAPDQVLMDMDNDPAVGEKRKADTGKAPVNSGNDDPKNDPKKNQMWVEKYRPSKLADVAAHKDIVDTISRLSAEDKLPHLLLYGPPGTGKTSTILALARELYGTSFSQMVLELNASDGTFPDRSREAGLGGKSGPIASPRSAIFGFQKSPTFSFLFAHLMQKQDNAWQWLTTPTASFPSFKTPSFQSPEHLIPNLSKFTNQIAASTS